MDQSTIRRQGKRLAVWLGVGLIVLAALTVGYFGSPYHGSSESIATVEDDQRVTVDRTDEGYVLQPVGTTPETGVVFYPGGRVHPDAYVGSLAALARDANVTVVIPKQPLNLAIVDYGLAQNGLGTHAADSAMADHPDVEAWYVGGHSLGGAMACRYAANADVEGLLLYGSYCDVDISERDRGGECDWRCGYGAEQDSIRAESWESASLNAICRPRGRESHAVRRIYWAGRAIGDQLRDGTQSTE